MFSHRQASTTSPRLDATPLTEAFTICTNDHIMQHHQRSGSRRVVEAQLAFLQLELYFRNRVAAVQRVAINTKCRYCFFSWLGLAMLGIAITQEKQNSP